MRALAVICLGVGAAILGCKVLGMSATSDPMLPAEIVAGSMLAAWCVVLGRDLWHGHRLGRVLSRFSRPATAEGVRYAIVEGPGVVACVVGGFRPRIYLSDGLLGRLSPQELQAILLHEEHHRRTWAPLRGSALRAWARLLGGSARARDVFRAREAHLECQADRYALRGGVSRGTIARALLKIEPTPFGAGFADHRDARIRALLDPDDGAGVPTERLNVPYEWVPILTTLALSLGCHLP